METTEKTYQITKEQCQKSLDDLAPIVCTRCGGQVEPIETVNNVNQPTHWPGCLKCDHFNWGVSPKIYATAVKMVDERNFQAWHYEEMPDKDKDPNMFDYWRKDQISGTVQIVRDVLRIHSENKKP